MGGAREEGPAERRLPPWRRWPLVLAALVAPSGAAADRAYNILPPGQWGGMPFTQNSRDQLGALRRPHAEARRRDGAPTCAGSSSPRRSSPSGPTTREPTPRRGLTIRPRPLRRPAHHRAHARRRLVRRRLGQRARPPAPAHDRPRAGARRGGRGAGPQRLRPRHGRAHASRPSPQAEALVTRQQRLFGRVHGAKGRQILRDLRLLHRRRQRLLVHARQPAGALDGATTRSPPRPSSARSSATAAAPRRRTPPSSPRCASAWAAQRGDRGVPGPDGGRRPRARRRRSAAASRSAAPRRRPTAGSPCRSTPGSLQLVARPDASGPRPRTSSWSATPAAARARRWR